MRDVGDLFAFLLVILLVFGGVPFMVLALVAIKRRRERQRR